MKVYIPVKNKREMTGNLLAQLKAQEGSHRITVMDNGSEEDIYGLCVEHQVEYWDCEGKTIHQMWNLALKRSRPGHVALFNNDLIIHSEDLLDRLDQVLDQHPEVGVVSPYFGHPDHRVQLGLISVPPEIGPHGGCAGFCFAISDEIARWYTFPKDLKWWCGDNDLFLTAMHVGKKALCVVRDVRIEHIDGGSMTARDEELEEICQRDIHTHNEKWSKVFGQDES